MEKRLVLNVVSKSEGKRCKPMVFCSGNTSLVMCDLYIHQQPDSILGSTGCHKSAIKCFIATGERGHHQSVLGLHPAGH